MIMRNQNSITNTSIRAFMAMAFLATSVQAATMSSGAPAPVVDGEDIANYGTTTTSDKWWPGSASAYGNPGKTVGQTFTTGSRDVLLNAITFQIQNATQPVKTYTVRVGTISGTTFTEIHSETAAQSFTTAADDYWTWTFATPVLLLANTVYGVDVGLNSSTSDWQTGIPYGYYMNTNVYPGGTRFRSGTAGDGVGDTSMTQVSGDRVFHIDLSNADPKAPFVDAGVDMVTWSGEAVQLAPTVVNKDPDVPQASLTYAWSADPADGVVFSATDTEAPTVTITKVTANPSTVTLTLAVNNVGSGKPDVDDTMTIYVYDDACQAGIDLGLVTFDPSDFNMDCVIDIEDFVEIARAWLADYTIATPILK